MNSGEPLYFDRSDISLPQTGNDVVGTHYQQPCKQDNGFMSIHSQYIKAHPQEKKILAAKLHQGSIIKIDLFS